MIEMHEVSRVFETRQVQTAALRKFSCHIGAGEFVAVVGPSGSGKSTFLNIAGLLDAPDKGTYHFDGADVSSLSDSARSRIRRDKIGFIFQNFSLIPELTVQQNIEVPLKYQRKTAEQRRSIVAEVLERVGLRSRANHYPAELSGGQQQRVAIARALGTRPKVILADEPTGNLDSEMAVAVMEQLVKLKEAGVAIVLVTHDPQCAAYAQRQIRIIDGVSQ